MAYNLADKISEDLRIEPFTNESRQSFCNRVVYSALRWWIHAVCLDDGAEGASGAAKSTISSSVMRTLDLAIDAADASRAWFDMDDGGAAATAYRTLLDIDDLITDGTGLRCRCTVPKVTAVTDSVGLITGYFDIKSTRVLDYSCAERVTSGLTTTVADSFADYIFREELESFESATEPASPWWPVSDVGRIVYIDPLSHRWNINNVDELDNSGISFEVADFALAKTPGHRRDGTDGYYRARMTPHGIQVREIPWTRCQELYFHLSAAAGAPASMVIKHLGDSYFCFRFHLGLLPTDERRFLRAVSWPNENASDLMQRVCANNALDLVKSVARRLDVAIKES